jgi:hypothetical protein
VPSSGSLSGQASLSDDGSGPDIPADLPDYCKGATQGKVRAAGDAGEARGAAAALAAGSMQLG